MRVGAVRCDGIGCRYSDVLGKRGEKPKKKASGFFAFLPKKRRKRIQSFFSSALSIKSVTGLLYRFRSTGAGGAGSARGTGTGAAVVDGVS